MGRAPEQRPGHGRRDVPLLIKATLSDRTVKKSSADVKVDTQYKAGPIRADATTVYPRRTLVRDQISVGSYSDPDQVRFDRIHRGTLRIKATDGDVVVDLPAKRFSATRWDGRAADGTALPAGEYRARFLGADRAGNRGRSDWITLSVSGIPLVEASGTATVTPVEAGGALQAKGYRGFCGSVVPSEIYPDGLSFRSRNDCVDTNDSRWKYRASSGGEIHPDLNAPRGIRSLQVSFRGRPTADGDTDSAEFWASTAYGGQFLQGTERAGETVVTPPWLTTTEGPRWNRADRAMRWFVVTSGDDSYDLGSLTFNYTYLTPLS